MIALYQNGEPLMPGNGFPMRLLLPGFEGNMNVKYVRRIKLVTEPAMSYWESQVYTEPMPKGKAYQFNFLNEVKSFITRPSPGLDLKQPGQYEISGVAYSGRGKITKVMVSADGGAKLGGSRSAGAGCKQGLYPLSHAVALERCVPPCCKAAPGMTKVISSRPEHEFVAARGELDAEPSVLAFKNHHFNAVTSWAVDRHGTVKHAYA